MKNPASELGKMAAGVPKKYSPAEIAKRTARLRKAQKKRAKTQRALRRYNTEYATLATPRPINQTTDSVVTGKEDRKKTEL